MTHFIYAEEPEPFTGRPVPYHLQNACRAWLRHYGNQKELDLIIRCSTNFRDVQQAHREMAKCQETLRRWERHPNFSVAGVAEEKRNLDQIWASAEHSGRI